MPKLKRASSSQVSSQAKKHKKKTRQDPVKRQQERERDRLRQMDTRRRELDAATHRQIRQNPHRRLMEQEQNTASRRQT